MLIVIFHFYSVAAMKNFFQVIKLIYNIRFRNPRISFTFLLTCKYCQYNTAKANVFHSTHSPSPKKKKKQRNKTWVSSSSISSLNEITGHLRDGASCLFCVSRWGNYLIRMRQWEMEHAHNRQRISVLPLLPLLITTANTSWELNVQKTVLSIF